MSVSPEVLSARAEVEAARSRFAQTGLVVRRDLDRVSAITSWVRKQPVLWLLGALAFGVVLGSMRKRR